jgi:hypothetical protein
VHQLGIIRRVTIHQQHHHPIPRGMAEIYIAQHTSLFQQWHVYIQFTVPCRKFKQAHAPFYLLALVHPNFLPVNAKTIYANTIISLKSIIKMQQRELTIPGIKNITLLPKI